MWALRGPLHLFDSPPSSLVTLRPASFRILPTARAVQPARPLQPELPQSSPRFAIRACVGVMGTAMCPLARHCWNDVIRLRRPVRCNVGALVRYQDGVRTVEAGARARDSKGLGLERETVRVLAVQGGGKCQCSMRTPQLMTTSFRRAALSEVASTAPEHALPAWPGRGTAREPDPVESAAPLEQPESTVETTRKRLLPTAPGAAAAGTGAGRPGQDDEAGAGAGPESAPARKRARGVGAPGGKRRAAPSIRSEPEASVVPAVWRDRKAETPPGSPSPGANRVVDALGDGRRVEAADEVDAGPEAGVSAAPSSPRVDAPSSPIATPDSGDEAPGRREPAPSADSGGWASQQGQRHARKSRKRRGGGGPG